MKNMLKSIRQEDIQDIFECLSQAVGEDRQEASEHLGLRTRVSEPFLNWDLIYRNLMNKFDEGNLKYSVTKRGMWTVLLLYDENSKLLFSFMRNSRFKDIKNRKSASRPQYVQALITLNAELQAPEKQIRLLAEEPKFTQTELERTLDELCANFDGSIDTKNSRHVMVVFSNKYGSIDSLKAYLLDRDLDIVFEQDWLDIAKPIMSSIPETVQPAEKEIVPTLKPKALNRIREKELVALKEQEAQKNA